MNRKRIVKIIKRYFLAFLICIPLFIVIGIFLQGKISDAWIITMYVIIGFISFMLCELVNKKLEKKRELKREKSRIMRKYNAKNRTIEQAVNVEKENSTKNKKVKNKDKNANMENVVSDRIENANDKNDETKKESK